LIADHPTYRRSALADGISPPTWRQGVKHDAAPVMELRRDARTGELRNPAGPPGGVQAEFIYPLLKATDLTPPPGPPPGRGVIVTQEGLGDDTARLAHRAPRLWHYLQANAERLARRRSSIYRGRPPFAIFGVGPYSFAPFKVAISGLHKAPAFRAVGPVEG